MAVEWLLRLDNLYQKAENGNHQPPQSGPAMI